MRFVLVALSGQKDGNPIATDTNNSPHHGDKENKEEDGGNAKFCDFAICDFAI
jgi:hypothetical protein